jgi:hypothetical protein
MIYGLSEVQYEGDKIVDIKIYGIEAPSYARAAIELERVIKEQNREVQFWNITKGGVFYTIKTPIGKAEGRMLASRIRLLNWAEADV